MQFLPDLVAGAQRWRLPLVRASAESLLTALAADTPDVRARGIAAAMEYDPSLVLWTVCRAGANSLRTLAQAAEWLAQHALEVLRWPEDDSSDPVAGGFAELAADSVRAAISARAAANASGGDLDKAYLCGLLCNAQQWFAACSVGVPGDELPLLADWLGAALPVEQNGFYSQSWEQVEAVRRQWLAAAGEAPLPLRYLVEKLSRLAELEAAFDRALEQAKLDALKEFAYGAGHEINNPLANISARAQTLLKDEPDPERRRKLAAINHQAFRAHEMIADMMLFARPPQMVRSEVNLAKLVDTVVSELASIANAQQTRLMPGTCDDSAIVEGDATQLAVALRALCINSLEALGRGGSIQVSAQRAGGHARNGSAASAGDEFEIIVADDGPGIQPEVRKHLFDPFYSGREAGRGLGFGLSKCWRIITAHGGRIVVDSSPGSGARFTITLARRAAMQPGRGAVAGLRRP